MAITRLKKHDSHPISIHKCKPGSVHFAALRCSKCDTHIQWINKTTYDNINKEIPQCQK